MKASAIHAGSARGFLTKVASWAEAHPDIHSVLLVGSYARGDERSTSDIDFVILAEHPDKYLQDSKWAHLFGPVGKSVAENWGKVISLRVWYSNGIEVEFSFTNTDWLSEPVDLGTKRVLENGFIILFERK